MPKVKVKEAETEIEEVEVEEEEAGDEEAAGKVKAVKKVEAKAKKVEEASGGKAVNVIGEIEKPDDDAPDSEWKAWGQEVSAKLDRILARVEKEEEEEEEAAPAPVKKKSWLDQELF